MENDEFNGKVIENLTIQNANLSLENTKLRVLVESLQTLVQTLEAESASTKDVDEGTED